MERTFGIALAYVETVGLLVDVDADCLDFLSDHGKLLHCAVHGHILYDVFDMPVRKDISDNLCYGFAVALLLDFFEFFKGLLCDTHHDGMR